jgi:hypothetical protein
MLLCIIDMQRYYAMFTTLSDGIYPLKLALMHDGRINQMIPGENNLFHSLEKKIQLGNKKQRSKNSNETNYNSNLNYHHDSIPLDTLNYHMIIHNGDFIHLNSILESRIMIIYDLLLRNDCHVEIWEDHLISLEHAIRNEYRQALNNGQLRDIFRQCGQIFLPGRHEAGANLCTLLGIIHNRDHIISCDHVHMIIRS